MFFKAKEENSGFPADISTEEEKTDFLRSFEDAHGIRLDREKMERPNKALRFVSKLMCNSLWGRFAMRIKRTNYTFARSKEEVENLWYNPSVSIKNDMIMPDSNIWCFIWEPYTDCLHSAEYGSLIIGIVTLACARVHLTKLMLEIEGSGRLRGKRPMLSYHDTDSLMIKADNEEEEEIVRRFLKRNAGDNLGDLTNEIVNGFTGIELISPGGKQYLLRSKNAVTGETIDCVKLSGFTQNFSTNTVLNYETMFQKTIDLQDGVNKTLLCLRHRPFARVWVM